MERINVAAAARIALAAQGFGQDRSTTAGMRQIQREISRLGQFQIDSVNVCVRAHLMPLYSRLGAYDEALLHRTYAAAPRRMFEYWGHAASLIDVSMQPALRWRQARAEAEAWGSIRRIQTEHPELVERVYERVCAGQVTAREVNSDLNRAKDSWGWNWSSEKTAMEWLFYTGRITSAGRTTQFERIYDIPERVLPRVVLDTPTPDPADAIRELVRTGARALGIGTARCFADYFRVPTAMATRAVAELEEAGELVPVIVDGWPRKTWLWHEARRPRRIRGQALVSPFDSLVFERQRLEELFGIHYRIGIYTPAAQRENGYYVYLFVCDEQIAARVDLKADRARGVLCVQGAWRDADGAEVVPRLHAELVQMAQWLGLSDIDVAQVGDLAAALTAEHVRQARGETDC